MSEQIIVIGLGGHALILIEILMKNNLDIIGATDINKEIKISSKYPVKIIGDDNEILNYSTDTITLVNGIGSIPGDNKRKDIFEIFTSKKYLFSDVIHSSVILSKEIVLKQGVQIMAGAIIQRGSLIGSNTIINTKASIDHDCSIGNNCHVAPGVTLGGNVRVGNNTFIGAGSTVINNITVGSDCIIGAGTIVYEDINNGTRLIQKLNMTPQLSNK